MTKKRTRRGRQIDGATDDGDHVEKKGIMNGADRLDALRENRWNRQRKLLPKLKLTYPADDEIRHIAELAKVDDALLLRRSIDSIILDAHLTDASFRTLSIPQVRNALNGVATQANRLGKILSKLDVGRESKGSEKEAGRLIELELAVQQFEISGMVLLPEYIDLLDTLSSAAQRAKQKPMHVPKGAGGNWAFDNFIEDLVMAARMGGGSWTIYRSRDDTWKGTLLEALGLLEKYLPEKFFPTVKLGRSVEHIRKKLADHIRRGS